MPRLTNSEFLESMRAYELERVLQLADGLKIAGQAPNILEIGAGAGWQAKRLCEAGYRVEAIDLADGEYANNRVWPITDYDGQHIPFGDEYFDLLFSSNVLEHIIELRDFQNEMRRVLKSDGIAIHIVPSGSWRFWTSLCHYPSMFRLGVAMIRGRNDQSNVGCVSYRRARGKSSPLQLLRKALLPTKHGETGTALSELYSFSRMRWRSAFKQSHWKIRAVIPNRLFYTGYQILGSSLPIRLRRLISYVLGSSCHIFILSK